MPVLKIAPIIITVPGPIPYTSDKAVLWYYGEDVYVLGVKQEFDTSIGVSNITGPAKILAVAGCSHQILRRQLFRNLLSSHLQVCMLPFLIKFLFLPLLPSNLTLGAKGLLLICLP